MAPARGDNEKYASNGECNACDDISHGGHLESRDLSGDKPDTSEQDQQESHLSEDDSRLTAHETDGSHFEQSEVPYPYALTDRDRSPSV